MTKLLVIFLLLVSLTIMADSVSVIDSKPAEFEGVKQVDSYESLAELQWKYRVILVKSNDAPDIATTFTKLKEAIDDRKIAWFVIHDEKLHSNIASAVSSKLSTQIKDYLAQYQYNDMVLIGYDGEIKSSENDLNIAGIFEQIDSMPIRQYEMTNK